MFVAVLLNFVIHSYDEPDRKEKELERRIKSESKSRVDAHTYDKSGQLLESFGVCGLVNVCDTGRASYCAMLFFILPSSKISTEVPLGVCEN
ncbi:hypothetical protein VNO80_24074 [Phaseolus coccineus]|uniref:Uncharacterized protein n=1 Tax=Phaseolus coccineus TaxID=3886 RepID=A0AAN9QMI4_PHACN